MFSRAVPLNVSGTMDPLQHVATSENYNHKTVSTLMLRGHAYNEQTFMSKLSL
jgi:hypothetical protein